jgi:hypothetical protein
MGYRGDTDTSNFNGRISSSIIYEKDIQTLPRCGEMLTKKQEDEQKPFFYAPSIKPYLTEKISPGSLPEGLTPVRLVADYLKHVHSFGVSEMKKHFQNKEASESPSNQEEKDAKAEMFTGDQIRYVLSIPDNQDGPYKDKMKEALIMAGIIESNVPEGRLSFIKESEATGYHCLKQCIESKNQLNPSLKPYLVCDIGGTVFGVSTIEAKELFETGTVLSHIDKSIGNCGTVDLNIEMRNLLGYMLPDKSGGTKQLKELREKLFEYYVENIKVNGFFEFLFTHDCSHGTCGVLFFFL